VFGRHSEISLVVGWNRDELPLPPVYAPIEVSSSNCSVSLPVTVGVAIRAMPDRNIYQQNVRPLLSLVNSWELSAVYDVTVIWRQTFLLVTNYVLGAESLQTRQYFRI
jgi:hypothetical protein